VTEQEYEDPVSEIIGESTCLAKEESKDLFLTEEKKAELR
jgi:hypothetical protein